MPLHVEAIRGVTRLDRKCRINYDRFLWTKHCREAKIIRERLVPFIKSNLIKLLIFIARMNFNNKPVVNTPSGKRLIFTPELCSLYKIMIYFHVTNKINRTWCATAQLSLLARSNRGIIALLLVYFEFGLV